MSTRHDERRSDHDQARLNRESGSAVLVATVKQRSSGRLRMDERVHLEREPSQALRKRRFIEGRLSMKPEVSCRYLRRCIARQPVTKESRWSFARGSDTEGASRRVSRRHPTVPA